MSIHIMRVFETHAYLEDGTHTPKLTHETLKEIKLDFFIHNGMNQAPNLANTLILIGQRIKQIIR